MRIDMSSIWDIAFWAALIITNVALGVVATAWWFTRARRRAQRELEYWLARLPKVNGLPPVRPPPGTRRTWANPNGRSRSQQRTIPTVGFWAPPRERKA